MPLSANLLKLESSILTRVKRATNRNNAGGEYFLGEYTGVEHYGGEYTQNLKLGPLVHTQRSTSILVQSTGIRFGINGILFGSISIGKGKYTLIPVDEICLCVSRLWQSLIYSTTQLAWATFRLRTVNAQSSNITYCILYMQTHIEKLSISVLYIKGTVVASQILDYSIYIQTSRTFHIKETVFTSQILEFDIE